MPRVKLLDRQKIINIACNEYWLNGIDKVPIAKIAKIAAISRPGIYIEFKNEDNLQLETLKHYTHFFDINVIKNYDDYNKYPNNLKLHLNLLINDNKKPPGKHSCLEYYDEIKRPSGSKGCLFRNSVIIRNKLGPLTKKFINKFEKYRINQFSKYIIGMKNDKKFKKQLNLSDSAKYINMLFGTVQIMKNLDSSKRDIKRYINISLEPLLEESFRNKYKFK